MATQSLDIYQADAQVGELKLWRAPEEVLIEAQQAAAALQKRIAGKANPVKFNGEQYIENDDWQMLAHFFGYAPKIESTEFVEYGDVQGFKAIAVLLNERTGAIVSRGEALCLDEEDNWGTRTKYEWQDSSRGGRKKVAIGEVSTPLFQLASMAQTRACNKAMSNKLKWVVSLAGYSTTPAEDMHDATLAPKVEKASELPTEIKKKSQTSAPVNSAPSSQVAGRAVGREAGVTAGASLPHQPTWCVCGHVSGQHGAQPPHICACDGNANGSVCSCRGFRAKPLTPQSSPQSSGAAPRGAAAPVVPQRVASPEPAPPAERPRSQTPHSNPPARNTNVRVITDPQARRFYAIRKDAGWSDSETKTYLRDTFGTEDDHQIPANRYEEACRWARNF